MALELGSSWATLQRWAKQGAPIADGAAAVRAWREARRAAKAAAAGKAPASGSAAPETAPSELSQYRSVRRQIAELELRQKLSRVVDVDAVRSLVAQLCEVIKSESRAMIEGIANHLGLDAQGMTPLTKQRDAFLRRTAQQMTAYQDETIGKAPAAPGAGAKVGTTGPDGERDGSSSKRRRPAPSPV